MMNQTTEPKQHRKRLYLALGMFAAVGALITAAAFIDTANINFGANGGAIGSDSFKLQVADVDPDGNPLATDPATDDNWVSASAPEGIDYNLPDADKLKPGDSSSVTIPIRNASNRLEADLTIGVAEVGVDSDAALISALRFSGTFTPTGGTAVPLFTDAAITAANANVADNLLAGAAGEVTITVTLPATASGTAGMTANIRALLSGGSVVPAP